MYLTVLTLHYVTVKTHVYGHLVFFEKGGGDFLTLFWVATVVDVRKGNRKRTKER